MGDDYKYRSADGSNNNPTLPWLGAANTPYCRTIPPLTIQPTGLPDAGLIFDSLFARQEFTPHPNKVSSVFFDWASLIIHGRLYCLLGYSGAIANEQSLQTFSRPTTSNST
jgi:linoleate 10R-lipoxygenase